MNKVEYSQEAKKAINVAENNLQKAMDQIRSPQVEIEPAENNDIEVTIPVTTSEIKEPAKEKEPKRSQFVETNDPIVKQRIDDLYGQVKRSDARNQAMLEHNKKLEEELSRAIEKLNNIEKRADDVNYQQVENDLRTKLRIAREENDYDTIDQIEDKLLDLRLEKREKQKAPLRKENNENVEQTSQPQPLSEADAQFVNNAQYVHFLATERDDKGNYLRPYLFDWHPRNKEAIELYHNIPKEYAAAGKQVDIQTIMQVIDERINNTNKSKRKASVLSTDDSVPVDNEKVRLSQEEAYVAKRLGLKPEAYARQKQLLSKN